MKEGLESGVLPEGDSTALAVATLKDIWPKKNVDAAKRTISIARLVAKVAQPDPWVSARLEKSTVSVRGSILWKLAFENAAPAWFVEAMVYDRDTNLRRSASQELPLTVDQALYVIEKDGTGNLIANTHLPLETKRALHPIRPVWEGGPPKTWTHNDPAYVDWLVFDSGDLDLCYSPTVTATNVRYHGAYPGYRLYGAAPTHPSDRLWTHICDLSLENPLLQPSLCGYLDRAEPSPDQIAELLARPDFADAPFTDLMRQAALDVEATAAVDDTEPSPDKYAELIDSPNFDNAAYCDYLRQALGFPTRSRVVGT